MELTVQELAKLEQTTYLLIDMRSEETRAYGMLPGAIPVLPEDLSSFAVEHPDKTLVLYCAHGEASIPAAEAAAGQDGLAHLFVLPPQSTLTIHVGKRKIKLRPEELQKVTGERGRRGSLMRGLQKIDRVEIDSPRRAAAGDSEE